MKNMFKVQNRSNIELDLFLIGPEPDLKIGPVLVRSVSSPKPMLSPSRVTLGQVRSGRVMVDLNAIEFRVQNGRLNQVLGSKRAVESGGSTRPDQNQTGHFSFQVISITGL